MLKCFDAVSALQRILLNDTCYVLHACKYQYCQCNLSTIHYSQRLRKYARRTWLIASRPAMATISAHETTPGQVLSNSALMLSITFINLMPKFLPDSSSLWMPVVWFVSNRIEASHPCNRVWKCFNNGDFSKLTPLKLTPPLGMTIYLWQKYKLERSAKPDAVTEYVYS